jgi:hypothetical protein
MMNSRNWLVMGLIAASVTLAGCGQTQAENAAEKPALVTPIQGTNVSSVVLTARAAERVGVKTAPVQQLPAPGAGAPSMAIPLAALVYDRDGSTWVYTTSTPLTYVRQPVTVARITGDVALLQAGPAPGTAVVTVGTAELLGSEYGVAGQ